MQIKFVAHYFKKAFPCRPLCTGIRAALYDIQIIIVYQFEGISWEQRKQRKNVEQVQRCGKSRQKGGKKQNQIFDQIVCHTNNYFSK